jgi:hypothetical protein
MFTRIAVLATAVGVMSVWAVAQGTAAGALSIELKGLTKDNAAKAETALAKLERDGFRCTTCDYFAKEAGDCPACKTALAAEKAGTLLQGVKIDAAKNIATFGVASAYGVRLSEIAAALKTVGIEIDTSKLAIAPFTRLTVTGIESEDAGKTFEKAFKDAKLYDAVNADVNAEHKMAILIVGGTKTAPTFETITKTVEKAGPFKITEVTWTAACPKCAEKGMKHAGCMSCWQKGT